MNQITDEKSWNFGNSFLSAKTFRVISVIAGAALVVIALISLLNTVLGFRVAGQILWLNLFYVGLNVFAAWGLFAGQKWIVPAFVINWLSTLIFFIQARIASGTAFDVTSRDSLMIVLSTALFLFVFASRRHLSGKYLNIPFAAFIALWTISLVLSL